MPSEATLGALAILMAVAPWEIGRLLAQAQPIHVEVEFLENGRCSVSSAGEGFRTHATYMPKAGARQPEFRCAMPPVPPGQTVALVVSLSAGMPRPGSSAPPLEWRLVEGRWVGTAQATSLPDTVVLSPTGGWQSTRTLVTTAGAILVIVFVAGLATYARRSRFDKPAR